MQAQARRAARPGRRRKAGGGRKPTPALTDRLLLPLIYYRAQPDDHARCS